MAARAALTEAVVEPRPHARSKLAPGSPKSVLLTPASPRPRPLDVFVCEEETAFYAACIQQLVFDQPGARRRQVIEFGTGDGTAVIGALLGSRAWDARIQGYEISGAAALLAQENAAERGLQALYQVHHGCFFEGLAASGATALIANPPYVPAPDSDILMPALFGGTDGGGLTRDLLSLGLERVMLLVPSYADPQRTLAHAKHEGYAVRAYQVTTLPFGVYSSQPKVLEWIKGMKADGRAHFTARGYKLAGILWERRGPGEAAGAGDRHDEVLAVLTGA